MPKKLKLYMAKDMAALNVMADTSSFTNQKLSQSSVCNTILKIYDQAFLQLKEDVEIDEERVYVLLMRFVELAIRIRKTKLYVTDKTYVDSLITPEKMKKAIEQLESLKKSLIERYEALKPAETVVEERKTIEVVKVVQKSDINLSTIVEKALITCMELIKLIEEFRELKLMIVDCRSEAEFNSEKISFEFVKNYSTNRVSYVNIPSNAIESLQRSGLVIWKLETKLNESSKEALRKRNSFDYIIIFDLRSDIEENSNVMLLKNAFFKFDNSDLRVKNVPLILDGGWQKWLFFYPAFKDVAEVKKEEKEIEKPKPVERKPAEINTNDLNGKDGIKIKEISIEPMNIETETINDVANDEEPKAVEQTNGNIEIPVFNKPAVNRYLKPKFANESEVPSPPPVEPKPRTSLKKPETQYENSPKPSNENTRPVEPRKAFVPPPSFGSTVQFPQNNDENIFSKIYKPVNRFTNRPIAMPMMKNAQVKKIINPATGIMTYVYQSGDDNTPTYTEKEQMPHDILKRTPKIENETRKEPLKQQDENVNTNNNVQKNTLKRVASTPNIKDSDSDTTLVNAQLNQLNVKPNVNRNTKPKIEPKLSNMPSMLSDLQPVWSTSSTQGLCGIKNLGNTCFMNSVLQCLSNCKLLRDYFVYGKYAADINRRNPLGFEGRIAEHFASIVAAIWSGQCKQIAPKRFKETIGTFNSQFLSFEQQDAQEFLLFLLDGLHEDLNKVTQRPKSIAEVDNDKLDDTSAALCNWKNHLMLNNSIIVDLFQGQFKSTLMCLTCKKKSVKFEAFMYLTLPVPSEKCTLYDCVKIFSEPEKMSGECRWNCPQCKKPRDAEKIIQIWSLPRLLIIHLKRFKYNVWRDKITTTVNFEIDNLDLSRYVLDKRQQDNCRYRLFATSNHTGTLDGGHYTALCKHAENERWYKFDDSDVKPVERSSVCTNASYILFYSRKEN